MKPSDDVIPSFNGGISLLNDDVTNSTFRQLDVKIHEDLTPSGHQGLQGHQGPGSHSSDRDHCSTIEHDNLGLELELNDVTKTNRRIWEVDCRRDVDRGINDIEEIDDRKDISDGINDHRDSRYGYDIKDTDRSTSCSHIIPTSSAGHLTKGMYLCNCCCIVVALNNKDSQNAF